MIKGLENLSMTRVINSFIKAFDNLSLKESLKKSED